MLAVAECDLLRARRSELPYIFLTRLLAQTHESIRVEFLWVREDFGVPGGVAGDAESCTLRNLEAVWKVDVFCGSPDHVYFEKLDWLYPVHG